ncbi:hypothetical protein GGX14DRAFT_648309 [Mycena pura]|uniref:TNT domain-containing protein n=1 Tax=Mycena pura TaxID=153505 RepID=A0AAD6YMN9_9AGAR|nr:hypothetical protein GGX14DRAFT_648309 [Mycena pura]
MIFSLAQLFHSLLLFKLVVASTVRANASFVPTNTNSRQDESSKCHPSFCHGTEFTSKQFLCGDPRLGPSRLPAAGHWTPLLSGYQRLAGLCPSAFLEKWFNTSTGAYLRAPADGFQLSTADRPIGGDQVLPRGMLLDAFGTLYDSALWPAGMPFALRALPPSSLDTPTFDDIVPYNYRVYRVAYPFVVRSGPAAAFFGQPGQGTMYVTRSSIDMLLQGGLLARVDLNEDGNQVPRGAMSMSR